MRARLLYQCGPVRFALENLDTCFVIVPAELGDGEGYVTAAPPCTGEAYLQMLATMVRWGLKAGVPQEAIMVAVGGTLDAGVGETVALEPAAPPSKLVQA